MNAILICVNCRQEKLPADMSASRHSHCKECKTAYDMQYRDRDIISRDKYIEYQKCWRTSPSHTCAGCDQDKDPNEMSASRPTHCKKCKTVYDMQYRNKGTASHTKYTTYQKQWQHTKSSKHKAATRILNKYVTTYTYMGGIIKYKDVRDHTDIIRLRTWLLSRDDLSMRKYDALIAEWFAE